MLVPSMRGLPFELLLALRYLRPKRTYVSIITLICIIGVMLGVAVLIIVISVMSGFDVQLRDRIIGFNAHLKITQPGNWLGDYAQVMRTVAANPGVKGVAPLVASPVLMKSQSPDGRKERTMPAMMRGIDPKLEDKVSNLTTNIQQGRYDLSDHGILVGDKLAIEMDLQVGDSLVVLSPRDIDAMHQSRKEEGDEVILPYEYVVRGIFNVGHYEYDSSIAIFALEDAQSMLRMPRRDAWCLIVMLKDVNQTKQVRAQLERALGNKFEIKTWMEENRDFLDALRVEKNVMFYILFFIMVVAAFGITSALITFVVQKTREIGMLKALGATSGQVMWIFLSQSMVVGVIGVLSGLGLGILALKYRNEFLEFMNRITGRDLFNPSIYIFDKLPALIVREDIAIICGGSLIICVIAGLLPAWNAGRLKPVEALRHE